MACQIHGGWRWLPSTIDADSHRNWHIQIQVDSDDQLDGCAQAIQTPGLPLPGDQYAFGNDLDVWAWCRGPVTIRPVGDKNSRFFLIDYVFSTRPADMTAPGGSPGSGRDNNGSRKKCADEQIQDPLSEPPAITISSIREKRQEQYDKDGKPFLYTSFEKIVGEAVEFDRMRKLVVIEQNVLNLELPLIESLENKVNDAEMWDLPARCWKLVDSTEQRKLYGTCFFYWTRRLSFESNAIHIPASVFTGDMNAKLKTFVVTGSDGKHWLPGWDHYPLDQSNKVLNGHWHWINGSWVTDNINGAAPDSDNPNHYVTARDREQQPIRVILSRTTPGVPANGESDVNYLRLQRYFEDDFFQLDIPATLE